MKEDELLDKLIELARSLNIDVRTVRGKFRDGACRVEDRNLILLNRTSPVPRRITALAEALSDRPLENVFLLPAVRDVIDKARREPAAYPAENKNV